MPNNADLVVGTQKTALMWVATSKKTISAIKLISVGNLTANDTNYAIFTAYVFSSALSILGTIGSINTKTIGSGGTGNWVIPSFFSFPINFSEVNNTNIILIQETKAGSGVIVPEKYYQIDFL